LNDDFFFSAPQLKRDPLGSTTRAMKEPKRLQTYETPEITVTFDPNVCIHSGVCVRGLPAVFDVKRKRWVRPELAPAKHVAEQVSRCPSGALQYQWKNRGGAA
jgi:uncharacterized Fe-S cluster protein YjdI